MDLQKTIEFILEQQARSASRQEALEALVYRMAQQQQELINHFDHFQHEMTAIQLTIVQEQKRLAEAQARLTEEQGRLAQAQRHTEERLNALIAVVDGMIRDRPRPQ